MHNCQNCLIRKQSSFLSLRPEELETLTGCKTSFSIKKGDSIFTEGEHINGIFCIKKGACKMTKLSANGNEQVVKLSNEGELLGQRSMISDEAVGLSAIAMNEMDLCYIPKETILDFFNKNNQFSMSVMKSICSDLKEANNLLVDMAQKSVRQRLAGALLYLKDTFGTEEDGSLKIRISREELSGITGTATESCIRMLSDLQKAGKIKLSGKKIIVADTIGLQKVSGQML
nr:Crp/Fnr family transcriptional regulator [uncultured Flavobacterium sp.]